MATEQLKNIFLSASIPFKERDPKYFDSADIIAIRDAVIALSTVIIPKNRLIWGGHPSITPIIYYVMKRLGLKIQDHITLYQSQFYEKYYPEDNNKFHNVILTEEYFYEGFKLTFDAEKNVFRKSICGRYFYRRNGRSRGRV